jgi:hypothetical protein
LHRLPRSCRSGFRGKAGGTVGRLPDVHDELQINYLTKFVFRLIAEPDPEHGICARRHVEHYRTVSVG